MLKHRQAGVTLIELMIGMLIGLFVNGGVIRVYIAISQSSAETLKQARLNQEMSAIMNVMTNDIRRAGYWVSAGSNRPHENPYMAYNAAAPNETTALQVRDVTADAYISDQASGNCIIYTYDTNEDANTTVELNDRFGFKLDTVNGEIEMKRAGSGNTGAINSCADGIWEPVNDTSSITITGLTFDLANSSCVNSSEPDEEEDGGDASVIDDDIEYDCFIVTPDTEEVLTIVREVQVTLNAQLTNDPLVRSSMTQTVRARNDWVRIQP